jgi:ribosome-binding factor A
VTGGGSGAKGGAIQRRERVAHALREALIEAIAADVKDPRVHAPALLTVSRVELNIDMAVANVYVSIRARADGRGGAKTEAADAAIADAAIAGLEKAAGFLRGPIGRTVGLQRAPELRFFLDVSVDMSDKLAQILREDEDKAKAAGRVPGEPPPPEEKK